MGRAEGCRQQAKTRRLVRGSTVFDDPLVLVLADWEHGEPRIVAIGSSASQRVLFVVGAEWADDGLRIVSARKATKKERRAYEEDQTE
jgi:uncharacterized DUF497 family protein